MGHIGGYNRFRLALHRRRPGRRDHCNCGDGIGLPPYTRHREWGELSGLTEISYSPIPRQKLARMHLVPSKTSILLFDFRYVQEVKVLDHGNNVFGQAPKGRGRTGNRSRHRQLLDVLRALLEHLRILTSPIRYRQLLSSSGSA